jgi:multicomponent Na+:H+ antiporter subunit G
VATASGSGPIVAKSLVCAFILVTSPTAHAIAKRAYASGVPLWEGTVVDKHAEHVRQKKS